MLSTEPDLAPPTRPATAIEVRDLSISLSSRHGAGRVVDGVSFSAAPGEAFGLVGESGSGKSMTALAIMRLLPSIARVERGEVYVDGVSVLALDARATRSFRAATVGLVFQQARSSLNPLMRIGAQISRVLTTHARSRNARAARDDAVGLLNEVGLPSRIAKSYPHQLSGGMAQRALIATVLAAQPDVLIADEPTTGLDVTTEAEIYDLLAKLRVERSLCVVLITHDLAIVGQHCDRVGVMHAGNLVELGDVDDVFDRPLHPYTRGLLAAIPAAASPCSSTAPLIGEAPRLVDLPARGCRFIERCHQRLPECAESVQTIEVEPGHHVLCRLYG